METADLFGGDGIALPELGIGLCGGKRENNRFHRG